MACRRVRGVSSYLRAWGIPGSSTLAFAQPTFFSLDEKLWPLRAPNFGHFLRDSQGQNFGRINRRDFEGAWGEIFSLTPHFSPIRVAGAHRTVPVRLASRNDCDFSNFRQECAGRSRSKNSKKSHVLVKTELSIDITECLASKAEHDGASRVLLSWWGVQKLTAETFCIIFCTKFCENRPTLRTLSKNGLKHKNALYGRLLRVKCEAFWYKFGLAQSTRCAKNAVKMLQNCSKILRFWPLPSLRTQVEKTV